MRLGSAVLLLALTACAASEPVESTDPYCSIAVQEDALARTFDAATATPAETEGFYRAMSALAEQADAAAPATIAADVAVQRRVLADTIAVLEAAAWDLPTVVNDLVPIYEDAGYLAADVRLEEFATTVCGVDAGVAPADATVILPEHEAYCAAASAASRREELPPQATPDEARAHYSLLLDDLDALARHAPAAVADPLALIGERFDEVASLLEGAGWDLETGFVLIEEWASDPAVAGPMNEAIALVEVFDVQACGIES